MLYVFYFFFGEIMLYVFDESHKRVPGLVKKALSQAKLLRTLNVDLVSECWASCGLTWSSSLNPSSFFLSSEFHLKQFV